MRYLKPIIPGLGRMRKENCLCFVDILSESHASLSCRVRHCFKLQKQQSTCSGTYLQSQKFGGGARKTGGQSHL